MMIGKKLEGTGSVYERVMSSYAAEAILDFSCG
jgi:hypothetical protein